MEKAIEYYNQVLEIGQEIGNRRIEGYQFMNLGQAYSILEQIEMAINFYNNVLAIGKELKDLKIVDYCEDQLKSLYL